MDLVADTGPLIALAKVQLLTLLPQLGWTSVQIPPRVHRELLGKIGPESEAIDNALNTFSNVETVPRAPEAIRSAIAGLDEGEREVLCLAASMSEPPLVLLDDQAGRTIAKRLGFRVTGTAGLLLVGKKRGLIGQIVPVLQEARDKGYWLSDTLIESVRRLSGE